MKKRVYLLLLVFLLLLAGNIKHAAAANKITITPVAVSVSEGQSRVFTVQLDQPIIASSGDPNLYIDITASNPDKVTITPNTVTYTPAQWAQTKTFTVEVPANDVYGDSLHIIFTATGRSNAAYYSGFTAGFAINTTDTTPVPSVNTAEDAITPPPGTSDHSTPPPEDLPVIYTPAPPKKVAPVIKRTISYPASLDPEYTSGTDPVTQPEKSKLRTATYLYFSSDRSVAQKISAYFLLFVAIGLIILTPIVIYRRNAWLRKARERDVRWFYRHLYLRGKKLPAKRTQKRSVKRIKKPRK